MKVLQFWTALTVLFLVLAEIQAANFKVRKGNLRSRNRNSGTEKSVRRKTIVKCCGRNSCTTNLQQKWKSNGSAATGAAFKNETTKKLIADTNKKKADAQTSVASDFVVAKTVEPKSGASNEAEPVEQPGDPKSVSSENADVEITTPEQGILTSKQSSSQQGSDAESASASTGAAMKQATELKTTGAGETASTSLASATSASITTTGIASKTNGAATTTTNTATSTTNTATSTTNTATSTTNTATSTTNTATSTTNTATSTTNTATSTANTATTTTNSATTSTNTATTTMPTTTTASLVKPTCQPKCEKDMALFLPDGSLKDPDYFGFWETTCDELFVFGKFLANWTQNVERCCSLGMKPISIDNQAKSTCFNKFIDGKNWKYNLRYWTSGMRISPSQFQWCNNSATFDSTLWMDKQPDNVNGTENCAQLYISKKNSTARLADRNCKVVYAFACQGPTTAKPNCEAPACPKNLCQKNNALFVTLQDGVSSFLNNPAIYGQMVQTDNRTVMFSYDQDKKTFENALTTCCALGMRLVSLHQDHKYGYLVRALKSANLPETTFWTSGTDFGCEGSYGYCSTNKLIRNESKWVSGQPDNLNGNEHCVAVTVGANAALLRDENCASTMRYICEGKLTSGAEAVERECASAFNLTLNQTKRLLTALPETLQEKCFLRCYGEETDTFSNGMLKEEKIFAQFSSVSSGDLDKLTSMYTSMNECSNKTKGMDACDKAAELYKCGREKEPALLVAVMNNIEISLTEAPLVLAPGEAVCPTDYKCIVDEDMKLFVDQAPNNSEINPPGFRGYVTRGCGKTFLTLEAMPAPPFHSQSNCMEFCCQFGMRLATVETKVKYDCMLQLDIAKIWVAGYYFMVAGSSLGQLGRPKWCFTNNLVDPAIATSTNELLPNIDAGKFNVMMFFKESKIKIWNNFVNHFLCESV